MKGKLTAIAALAVAVAMALPAAALAGEWDFEWKEDPNGKALGVTFSTGIANLTTANKTIECLSSKGSGKYTSTTTGEIQLTFVNCKDNFTGQTCTTAGEAPGTIVLNNSVFHNVYLEPNANPTLRKPGILITAPPANFATFACNGGAYQVVVTGNVMGEVTAPACGGSGKAASVSFTSSAKGSQTWKQITTTGTFYDLIADVKSFAGEKQETASLDATLSMALSEEATLKCP